MEIIYKEDAFANVGACFEVYNDKGSGFLEAVYQECLELEFRYPQPPVYSSSRTQCSTKATNSTPALFPGFTRFGKIIVEIKAASALTNEHRAQVHNYLKATDYRLGLLVNLGHPKKLEYERIVRWTSRCSSLSLFV